LGSASFPKGDPAFKKKLFSEAIEPCQRAWATESPTIQFVKTELGDRLPSVCHGMNDKDIALTAPSPQPFD